MLSAKRAYTVFYTSVMIMLVLLTIVFRWQGNSGRDWISIIDGDAKGYYAYLEQILITHDFGHATVNYEQINTVNGHSVIKYYSGTALLISPFFLVSYAIASIGHLPLDAYSELFQKVISLAGIFYLLLGLFFAAKLLQQFKISLFNTLLTLALFLFGSNLLTYTVIHPTMSHVYSFFAVSLFLWLFNSFLISRNKKYLLLSAVTLGLIYLIRPFNIAIVAFLWFFIDDWGSVFAILKKHARTLLVSMLLFFLTISIQNILWFIQCREFFLWPYSHEGFYFTHPEFFRVLFGFRKGLFVYTPLIGISLLGLMVLLWKNKVRFLIAISFLIIITYLLSAWWCWSYSDGFGMRPFIDFYVVFILLFALLLHNVRVWAKWGLVVLSMFPLGLNLLQNYQYHKGIIHSEYMNRQRYQNVFLKTSDSFVNCFGGADDLLPYNRFEQHLILQTPLMPNDSTPDSANIVYQRGETGKAYCYDDRFETNFVDSVKNADELFRANKSYALIQLKKMDLHPTQFHKNLFVAALTYNDKKLAWFKTFPLEYYAHQPSSRWHEMTYTIILPKIQQKDFTLKFYIWNQSLDIFLVKDIQIKIYRTS